MQFKGLTLDDFQIEAIKHIEEHHSVIVSAATGTGKTLIADYTIKRFLDKKRRVIYTAPIKALSNQKYKDFIKDHGKDNVGIMTGDVVINPDAPLLVMTTEIYRNMLLAKDEIIQHLSYVIFDEIHFISDRERGTVWEESIIFSPPSIRFLCLSATIPNAKEFAEWISSIKGHPVEIVEYLKRAVPLTHYVYEKHLGICMPQDLRQVKGIPAFTRSGGKKIREKPAYHLDLIRDIGSKVPCIYFTFSRKKCEKYAHELAKKQDYTSKVEKVQIINIVNRYINKEVKQMQSYQRLRQCVNKGIAYHHAGLLPNLKEIVERLFEKGLISVLYATETFAVGVNMPAKTVCFDSLDKYDGTMFRYLNSKEYFQLAGRAGRRGIDKEGTVIALVDRVRTDPEKVAKISSRDIEPIISQFRLSYNTVLNLIKGHTDEEIDIILKSNFDYFLRKKSEKQIRIAASFQNKVKKLRSMEYIQEKYLTEKGDFATHIYFEELLISEIFFSKVYGQLSETEINCLIAAIVYEERRSDKFSTKGGKQIYEHIVKVIKKNDYVDSRLNKRSIGRLIKLISHWSDGGDFEHLLDYCNLLEGDIIRLFRRMIDVMKQINKATHDVNLQDKIRRCINKMDRDIVKAEFEGS
ncbi:DEAD/DEAH box helicase [Candidatus Woesearchaeota archaeon]|nr:DEAD/DEAH box helicase [Candidatus Woesearchaeota archaeon]